MRNENQSVGAASYPIVKLCEECSSEIDAKAVYCGGCGAEQPHEPSVYAVWTLAVLFALGAFKACLLG